jgi:hypothetical protein
MFKKIACSLLLNMLFACAAFAQVSAPPRVNVQDEGTPQGSVRTVNCTGAGVTCTVSAGIWTLNAAGGAGSANVVEASINLGSDGNLVYSFTVTGQTWVTSSSIIVCSPFATTADGQTVETYAAAMITVNAATRVAGTGFDLWVSSPHGATGIFRFHCTGA